MSEASASASEAQGGQVQEGENEFAALLNREFKPKSARAREAVESAVHTLAQQALAPIATQRAVCRAVACIPCCVNNLRPKPIAPSIIRKNADPTRANSIAVEPRRSWENRPK